MIQKNIGSDVIFSERRGQSQKPEEIYKLIESLVPDGNVDPHFYNVIGFYLEIFGRRNNVKSRWVTIGNEI
jgi:mRNA (2'-O-methyladenosine-N6-)-methyltransferase